ncbi:MAG TPA: hypothetical protein VHL78_13445 [Actinomycetota bacterium]|nr:hypothetical protein [Actinomycetota bacterium]
MADRPPGSYPSDRPQPVTIAAILLFVAGGLGILGGLLAFGAASLFGGFIIVLALINIAVGAAAIYAGMQIMALREQGRVLGLVIAGVGALFALVYLIAYQQFIQIIPLLLYGFVGYTLYSNAEHFRR